MPQEDFATDLGPGGGLERASEVALAREQQELPGASGLSGHPVPDPAGAWRLSPKGDEPMPNPSKRAGRRQLLRASMGLAVLTGLFAGSKADAVAASPRRQQAGRDEIYPVALTDENSLSADDPRLPPRARELIRIGEVGIARENPAALAAFFHPDFRFHGPRGAELNREQLWAYFSACRAAFDEFTVTRQTLISDGGDYIAARTRFAGKFVRPFTGAREGRIEPNGRPFEYRPINIFRYAPNGQLIEEWVQYDVEGFLSQLRERGS